MIWLVGDDADLSAAYIGWLAERRGVEVVALREDRLGPDWWFGRSTGGELEVVGGEGGSVAIEVTGAFVRLNPDPAVPQDLGVPDELRPLFVQERRAGLCALLDLVPPWSSTSPRRAAPTGRSRTR